MDGRGVVASALTIKNGRIVNAAQRLGPDAQTIDLGGRTVIPGLFDSHAHYTRAGVNPGYEARRIERAFSIAELQETIARRAESVPPGELITCIGGWNHTQFAEARRPTRADLDAAAPRHAVYISGTGGGDRRHHEQSRPDIPRREGRGGRRAERCGDVSGRRRRRAPGGADARTQAARHRRSERAREQPRTDRRHQRGQSPGPGVRAPSVAPGQAHHPHATTLPGRLAAGGRGARPQQLQPVGPCGGRRPVQGVRVRRENRRHRYHVRALRADRPDDCQTWLAPAAAFNQPRRKRPSPRRVSIDCTRPSDRRTPLVAHPPAKHRCGPAQDADRSRRRRQRADVDLSRRPVVDRRSAGSSTPESAPVSAPIPPTSPRSIPGCRSST